MMKRIFCLFAASLQLLSLVGCGAKVEPNSTYTGTVSAIDSKSITLETEQGKVTISLTENTRMTMGGFEGFGQMGQMPENFEDMPTDQEQPPVPADKPKGDFERPEGDFTMPEGGFERPEGEMPDFGQFPEGQMPEGMTPPDGFGGGFGGMDLSSLPLGTSVTVTTGADKTAATISMNMSFQGFGGQMPAFGN